MNLLEKAARVVDPYAWEFYDKWISTPEMGAECRYEVSASFAKARAVLMSIRDPMGNPAVDAAFKVYNEYDCVWMGDAWAAGIDAIMNEEPK